MNIKRNKTKSNRDLTFSLLLWIYEKEKKTRQARKRERKHDEKYQQASSTSITFTIASRPSHMHECMCPQCWSNHRESKPSSTLYFLIDDSRTLPKLAMHVIGVTMVIRRIYTIWIGVLCSSQYMNQISHIITMVSCTVHVFTIIKQYSLYVFYDTKNEIEKRKEKKMNRCSK